MKGQTVRTVGWRDNDNTKRKMFKTGRKTLI